MAPHRKASFFVADPVDNLIYFNAAHGKSLFFVKKKGGAVTKKFDDYLYLSLLQKGGVTGGEVCRYFFYLI
jgi:hypothetical protein